MRIHGGTKIFEKTWGGEENVSKIFEGRKILENFLKIFLWSE